ncbi:MAG TPA: hypothetical protein VMF13_06200 [Luteitalea sp.]|nr:hypothetical protein [Luteitalea sp.]
MNRFRQVRLLLVCGLMLVARPAVGQTGVTNGRVFSSLFGAAASDAKASTALDVDASLFAGYDDDVFARSSRPRPDASRLSGTFAGLQAGLSYRRRLSRGALSGRAQTGGRYLPQNGEFIPTYHSGALSYGTALSPRNRFAVTQRVAYRPFFSVVPFSTGSTLGPSVDGGMGEEAPSIPEDVDGDPGGDFSLASDREAVTYGTVASLVRQMSDRAVLQFAGRYSAASFLNADVEGFSNTRWGLLGNYVYRFTDHLGVRVGYGFRRFEAREGPANNNHDINLGLIYNQPFVFGRGRTTLAFSTGSTTLVRRRLDDDGVTRRRFVWRALGTATLTHDFVGPWQAQASYVRTVGYLDGLTDPFYGDRLFASIGGLIGLRSDLFFSAGYLSGSVGLSRRNYDTATAGVRLRTGLSRTMALFAQYYYFQYQFDESIAQDLFVPEGQERQGFRAGLTVWVPLLRR